MAHNSSMSAPACRICWEEEQPLLRPCGCKGSMAWAHASCVDDWRWVRRSNTCELCRRQYTTPGAPPLRRHVCVYVDVLRLWLEARLPGAIHLFVEIQMNIIDYLLVCVVWPMALVWITAVMINVILCIVAGSDDVCREWRRVGGQWVYTMR
jgi:hypothetical protein